MLHITENRKKYIGMFIKSLREQMGLTQQDVSDEIGFSVQTISKLENGRSNPYSYASKKIIDYVLELANLQDIDTIIAFDDFCSCMENVEHIGYEFIQ